MIERRIAAMASLGLAIVFSGSVAAQDDNQNQTLMNLVVQVQQLQDEVRMLRGQLEEQNYKLESLERRQRDQYLDLDQRISETRGGQPAVGGQTSTPSYTPSAASTPSMSGPSVTAPSASDAQTAPSAARELPELGPVAGTTATTAGATGGVSTSGAPGRDVPEVTERGGPPSAVTAIEGPTVSTTAAPLNPEAEQAAYDEAFQALKELRYADAAESFQSFLRQYPDSALAGNAQYWLGESYYVTRNYEIALNSFQSLIQRYPDSTKRGDGLLKIGFTHYELRQYDQARAALEQVQQEFPNSTLSRLADSRLRSMRLEGQF